MLRTFLIYLSRASWARRIVTRWKIARLVASRFIAGETAHDAIRVIRDLNAKGIDLYLHKQGLDTSTPTGRMLFHLLSVFREFEREIIKERIYAGLARAKASGKALGPPASKSKAYGPRIRELLAEGRGQRETARMAGCGISVVRRIIRIDKEQEQTP